MMKLLNEDKNSKQNLFQRIFKFNSTSNTDKNVKVKSTKKEDNFMTSSSMMDYRKSWTIGWSMNIYSPMLSRSTTSTANQPEYSLVDKSRRETKRDTSAHGMSSFSERTNVRSIRGLDNDNDTILRRLHSNYHAYSIITRWKLKGRESYNTSEKIRIKNSISKKNILQFVCIQRPNGECYIPGDKSDLDELISSSLRDELIKFIQKTYTDMKYEHIQTYVKAMFGPRFAKLVYKGFLFDSRISDNTWVKAKVYNFHDEEDLLYKLFWLDDYKFMDSEFFKSKIMIKWIDMDRHMNVFLKHKELLEKVARDLNAHW